MKDKEKIFKVLRESVETPQESFAVEEMIHKIEGIMPPIETVSDTQKKFVGIKFSKKEHQLMLRRQFTSFYLDLL